MNENFGKIAVEVLTIIDLFDSKLKEKIPKDFIRNLQSVKSDNYRFSYNFNKALEEQDIFPQTKGIIAYIYSNFICDKQTRKDFYNLYYKRQYELELKKKEMFENKNNLRSSNKVQFARYNVNTYGNSNAITAEAVNLPILRKESFIYKFAKIVIQFLRKDK